MTSDGTAALRATLVAIMADADTALSTNDILHRLADGGRRCASPRHPDGSCAHNWAMPDGSTCAAGCWYGQVYPQLLALRALGVIEHVSRTDTSRVAHWWLADRPVAPPVSDAPGRFAPRVPRSAAARAASPRIVAVRQALLAVIGAAKGPVSTNVVCHELPGRLGCDQHRPRTACVQDPGAAPCRGLCWYTTAYPQLCRLAEMGLVRHKPRFAEPVTRVAMWSAVPDADSDAAMNAALEDA